MGSIACWLQQQSGSRQIYLQEPQQVPCLQFCNSKLSFKLQPSLSHDQMQKVRSVSACWPSPLQASQQQRLQVHSCSQMLFSLRAQHCLQPVCSREPAAMPNCLPRTCVRNCLHSMPAVHRVHASEQSAARLDSAPSLPCTCLQPPRVDLSASHACRQQSSLLPAWRLPTRRLAPGGSAPAPRGWPSSPRWPLAQCRPTTLPAWQPCSG